MTTTNGSRASSRLASRRFHPCYKLAHPLAGRRRGPRRRRYGQIPCLRPSRQEWADYRGKKGCEGGMRAEEAQYKEEVKNCQESLDPPQQRSSEVTRRAEEDVFDIARVLANGP